MNHIYILHPVAVCRMKVETCTRCAHTDERRSVRHTIICAVAIYFPPNINQNNSICVLLLSLRRRRRSPLEVIVNIRTFWERVPTSL